EGLHYKNLLFRPVRVGRHIAPVILTRLPVDRGKTDLLNKSLRILRGVIKVDGKELTVIASHWTSRVSDRSGKGTTKGRGKYASLIYGRFLAAYKRNPKIDYLVCGDFNDSPSDPSVTDALHATGDEKAVRAGGAWPKMLNLFAQAHKNNEGTHYYR